MKCLAVALLVASAAVANAQSSTTALQTGPGPQSLSVAASDSTALPDSIRASTSLYTASTLSPGVSGATDTARVGGSTTSVAVSASVPSASGVRGAAPAQSELLRGWGWAAASLGVAVVVAAAGL